MLQKKDGVINNIIYNHTAYNGGKHRKYLSVAELREMIKKIIEAKETTAYIRITPFYRNPKAHAQLEFDEDYMFFWSAKIEWMMRRGKSRLPIVGAVIGMN